MEKIKITIPDNLTHAEEIIAIAKQLGQKMLPSGQLQLGSGYEIRHLNTTIEIERKPVEKPIVTLECSVCKSIFEKSTGSKLWINYGGKTSQRHYCSDECRSEVIEICGEGRASIKKSKLKPFRAY